MRDYKLIGHKYSLVNFKKEVYYLALNEVKYFFTLFV